MSTDNDNNRASFAVENASGADDLPEPDERPDEPGRFRCPKCGNPVTKATDGTEYGHMRRGYEGDDGAGPNGSRCPFRPESVDPTHPAPSPTHYFGEDTVAEGAQAAARNATRDARPDGGEPK